MTIKPKIRYVKTYYYGISCIPFFICESKESTKSGKTPKEAYENWVKDVPKTVIGRFFRRVLNGFLDLLV